MGIEDNIWHVYPEGDTHEHILGAQWCTIDAAGYDIYGEMWHRVEQRLMCPCPCVATIKEEECGFIIVHNSYDGREGVEWANEILNKE